MHGLSGNQATGIDKIFCKIIKIAAPVISDSLTLIFNQAIILSSFPDEWKIARVVPTSYPGSFFGEGKTQPRSQGLRGETVTKTLVKFVLSFQNFGKKIACAVRQPYSTVIAIRLFRTAHAIFFPKFWNDKTNFTRVFVTVSPRRPWDRGWERPWSELVT